MRRRGPDCRKARRKSACTGRSSRLEKKFEEKKFIGFYSFNPYLVQSIRWRFNLLSCGLSRVITHWEKSFPFPDLKMRDLDRLIRKPDAVNV